MIAQFTFRLIAGISFMWVVMPRNEVTCGFFRIQMMLVLGLSVLAGLTVGRDAVPLPAGDPMLSVASMRILCGAMAAGAYVGSVVWLLARRGPGNVCVFVIFLLATIGLCTTVVSWEMLGTRRGQIVLLSELSTAMILGSALTGMLLGHWYLTVPTMSIKPLSSLTLWFGAAALIRFLLSGSTWFAYSPQIASTSELSWLILRWVAGILGPLAVFVMTWRILKYRNTQSATGVLFVGVILTFLGELSALLLYRSLGIPL